MNIAGKPVRKQYKIRHFSPGDTVLSIETKHYYLVAHKEGADELALVDLTSNTIIENVEDIDLIPVDAEFVPKTFG